MGVPSTGTCNMNEPQRLNAEWSNSYIKDHMLCGSIDIKCPKQSFIKWHENMASEYYQEAATAILVLEKIDCKAESFILYIYIKYKIYNIYLYIIHLYI